MPSDATRTGIVCPDCDRDQVLGSCRSCVEVQARTSLAKADADQALTEGADDAVEAARRVRETIGRFPGVPEPRLTKSGLPKRSECPCSCHRSLGETAHIMACCEPDESDTTAPSISDEVVKAAANAIHDDSNVMGDPLPVLLIEGAAATVDGGVQDWARDVCRHLALVSVTAAAPHLCAAKDAEIERLKAHIAAIDAEAAEWRAKADESYRRGVEDAAEICRELDECGLADGETYEHSVLLLLQKGGASLTEEQQIIANTLNGLKEAALKGDAP